MSDAIQTYVQRVIDYAPAMMESMGETGIMRLFSTLAAILLGLPLGTFIFLTSPNRPLENKFWNQMMNVLVNIVRSFPFLLLVIVMQPLIRATYGRATGDPIAASFPMMVISIALYARFVEQSLLDLPKEITETAQAFGATTSQYVFKFLFVEARSSLIIGFTTAFVSFISYSTIMGTIGGGGIGDFAIRYGYHRYETDIMFTAIIIIIVFVQVFQWAGLKLAHRLNHK